MNPEERLRFIRSRTVVSSLDDETAEAAGRISAERRPKAKGWGLIDACVLATARAKGLKIVTGDEHFKGLNDAIMI